MPRKTLRPDDLVWQITELDVQKIRDNKTVGAFLDYKKMARKAMKTLFEEKLVLLNGHKTNPKVELAVGDELRLQMCKEKIDYEPRYLLNTKGIEEPLKILFEDDDLLVVDKPAGVTVNSAGQISVANAVAAYFKEQEIRRKVRFLNRLDRDTSGCLVIAKSALVQGFYQQQIETNEFEKKYTVFVLGDIKEAELTSDGVLELAMAKDPEGLGYKVVEINQKTERGTKNSKDIKETKAIKGTKVFKSDSSAKVTKTGYKVVALHEMTFNGKKHFLSELEVQLLTGKTHQIRVAFAHYGHPLAGDVLYGGSIPKEVQFGNTISEDIVAYLRKSFYLRAKSIEFTSLRTGKRVYISAD